MQQHPLGKSGLRVSAVALGSGAMGENSTNHQVDDREAMAAIHHAIDAGCNFIDTAPSYGQGHAEELVGKAILGRRAEVLIGTKCGLVARRSPDEPSRRSLARVDIVRECDQSLRRLRIDAIDLYQCHWPDPLTPIRETMEALQTLRTLGKIRAVGLCNFSCDEIAAAREFGVVDAVQTGFSLLHRRPADDLVPYCAEHGLGVLAYSPLAKGLLSGRLTPELRFTGIRSKDPEFVGERYRRNLKTVEALQTLAAQLGKSLAQLAINWVISRPGVTAAIVGLHRPSQVEDVLGGVGWELTAEDLTKIDQIMRDQAVES